jgi:hypothetical protein
MRAIKIAGTVAVTVLVSYPLWAPQWGAGILGEFAGLPPALALGAVASFFGLVALYCRTLWRTLTLVRPQARAAPAASVWWMFAIPYNFTEDFFIIRTIATSLAADARVPARELRRWSAAGYGWCALQILSLFPGAAGYLGGAVAVPLWVAHWIMSRRINRRLGDRTANATVPAVATR